MLACTNDPTWAQARIGSCVMGGKEDGAPPSPHHKAGHGAGIFGY